MSLQDTTRQAVTDFFHYTMIFNEAEQGNKKGERIKNQQASGTGVNFSVKRDTHHAYPIQARKHP